MGWASGAFAGGAVVMLGSDFATSVLEGRVKLWFDSAGVCYGSGTVGRGTGVAGRLSVVGVKLISYVSSMEVSKYNYLIGTMYSNQYTS